MLQWPDAHYNDYIHYTTATTDYLPIQKPIYTENHIYKRRNRRSSLAKRKGAEARRCRNIKQERLTLEYISRRHNI